MLAWWDGCVVLPVAFGWCGGVCLGVVGGIALFGGVFVFGGGGVGVGWWDGRDWQWCFFYCFFLKLGVCFVGGMDRTGCLYIRTIKISEWQSSKANATLNVIRT